MEGLKPYICIHFTRTQWLPIAVFQTCPYRASVGRVLQSAFSGGEGQDHHLRGACHPEDSGQQPLHSLISPPPYAFLYRGPLRFHLGLTQLHNKKNIGLTSLQSQPLSCFSVMIHSGISAEMDSGTTPLKTKQNLPTPGTPMGWGWKPRLRYHADVQLP